MNNLSTYFIGLGHYSNVGKDTLADYILEEAKQAGIRNALKISLASKLKSICYELYSWAGMKPEEYYNTLEGREARDKPLPALANRYNLNGLTPTQVWVNFGTEAVRNEVFEDTWIQYLLNQPYEPYTLVVVPDVRFHNEVKAIRVAGGALYKVERPGIKPRQTVADLTLCDYDEWDDVLVSESGDFDQLREHARNIAFRVAGIQRTKAIKGILRA